MNDVKPSKRDPAVFENKSILIGPQKSYDFSEISLLNNFSPWKPELKFDSDLLIKQLPESCGIEWRLKFSCDIFMV